MQYFRPGSQLRQLITMLSIVGEYPIRSLYLLGNERAYKALVHGRLSGTLSERSLIYEQSESFRPVLWTSD